MSTAIPVVEDAGEIAGDQVVFGNKEIGNADIAPDDQVAISISLAINLE